MILIVDDRPENLFSLKTLLQLHRFEVDTAASGEEALRKILRHDYALIILDVQMPGMDGYEVAENITGYSKSRDIPILFLSAVNIDKRFITRGYESGGVDYITKPFDPELLLLKVKTFYRLSEQQKALNEAHATLEQKVAERTAELVRTNEALEASNAELQQYAYLASHDLQEPLRKIMTFSSLVAERFLSDRPEAGTYVKRIIASSERMRNLINDLLEYSRISGNTQFMPTDLNQLLQEALSDLEVAIREKEVQVHSSNLPTADVIPGQIRQLFQNLLSNAIKFTRLGVRPQIEVRGEKVSSLSLDAQPAAGGNYLRLSVTDNGIGFNEAYLQKIFVLFQRLNGREEYAGTGLGLAIVKKIVDRHHGLVGARSREGEGACFIVVLPLQQQSPPAISR
ncbi:His Kinase A (phospho-acceptor) domain-containing protein [Cnuella takakiae]|uniref:histidine kinase n=1 Tax=Cnuella takakiae TaxID=1302690 RepID=A0A1M5BVZ3_9BACT|nr:response regulator [Cnuella takakiae]OLY93532.1 hybrid sensor histidine kinase/response regulator [Cnuella takakiae]SHF46556.1 His Kinase A (phospho-acceptor) domain-containing protein [Cnuella takakiae]